MAEHLDAYDCNGRLVKTREKELLLSEIKEYSITNGDANLAVPAALLLLVHPEHGIYVVKRAGKSENPFLWCKTVGEHVRHGETPDEAIIRGAKEEIGTSIVIAHSIDEYTQRLESTDLRETAVTREIDFNPWFGGDCIDRKTGRPWRRRFRATIYAGRFRNEKLNLPQRTCEDDFRDGLGEAVEFAFYQKDRLRELLAEGDRRFTHDLFILVRDYYPFL
ncbi:NUDIX domain-containing protein [Candidatus Woesearchaeota archaeon]|nr:NUDIX domain-containing protein [Candidatus Woesearchaeota archaeon]